MAAKTETSRHVIYRDRKEDIINDLTGQRGPDRTRIYDKQTGNWSEGIGNTREEADRAAWDDLTSKNRS
jgi:hypothetical protein